MMTINYTHIINENLDMFEEGNAWEMFEYSDFEDDEDEYNNGIGWYYTETEGLVYEE